MNKQAPSFHSLVLTTVSSSPVKSFLKGAARTVDLFGQLDQAKYKTTEKNTDQEAIRRDWQAVGKDIASAVQTYERNQKSSKSATKK